MTDYINERGALEIIEYMLPERLAYAKARLANEDVAGDRMDERNAIDVELARRAQYLTDTRPILEGEGWQVLSFTAGKYKAFLNSEGLPIPGLGRAETLDQAWAAVIRTVRRDPAERPPV